MSPLTVDRCSDRILFHIVMIRAGWKSKFLFNHGDHSEEQDPEVGNQWTDKSMSSCCLVKIPKHGEKNIKSVGLNWEKTLTVFHH